MKPEVLENLVVLALPFVVGGIIAFIIGYGAGPRGPEGGRPITSPTCYSSSTSTR